MAGAGVAGLHTANTAHRNRDGPASQARQGKGPRSRDCWVELDLTGQTLLWPGPLPRQGLDSTNTRTSQVPRLLVRNTEEWKVDGAFGTALGLP